MDLMGIENRISEAFGFATRAEIADKMGVNYQTLSNWLKGRTDFPTSELAKIAKLTDYSLNWILTGEGEKRTAKPDKPSLLNEDNLESFVRGITREEIQAAISTRAQELGTIDEFDVATALKKYDNAVPVIIEWYEHDGLQPPDIRAIEFSDWDKMTFDEKVEEVRATREQIDRRRKLRQLLEEDFANAPEAPKHT